MSDTGADMLDDILSTCVELQERNLEHYPTTRERLRVAGTELKSILDAIDEGEE